MSVIWLLAAIPFLGGDGKHIDIYCIYCLNLLFMKYLWTFLYIPIWILSIHFHVQNSFLIWKLNFQSKSKYMYYN